MALNAASHNTPGVKTGPVTEPPPELDNDIAKDVVDASKQDSTGQSAPGRDGGAQSGKDIASGDGGSTANANGTQGHARVGGSEY